MEVGWKLDGDGIETGWTWDGDWIEMGWRCDGGTGNNGAGRKV